MYFFLLNGNILYAINNVIKYYWVSSSKKNALVYKDTVQETNTNITENRIETQKKLFDTKLHKIEQVHYRK